MRKRELNKLARECFDKHVHQLAPGETTHCDHEGCPAGEDTRGRLYLTRKVNPEQLVVWYCHNCSEGGAFSTSGKHRMLPNTKPTKGGDCQYILDVITRSVDITQFPPITHAQNNWLGNMCSKHVSMYYPPGAILYDPMDGGLVFPIWTPDEAQGSTPFPMAMQKRYHRDFGPKCITTKANDSVTVRQYLGGEFRPEPVVIVEDVLSGHHITQDTGMGAYVLFGNHMDISELVEHKHIFRNGVLVWLDNDNEQVLENSRKITKRAEMLGIPARRVSVHDEPKLINRDGIMDILGKAWL